MEALPQKFCHADGCWIYATNIDFRKCVVYNVLRDCYWVENYKIDEIAASEKLYNSVLYEKLEQEETKLWHLSPLTLYNMFDEEQNTGFITYPEET